MHQSEIEYSFAAGGVSNRTPRAKTASSIAALAKILGAKPVELPVSVTEYHDLDKRQRAAVKAKLPYFVGGVINGTRSDANLTARTLLTLDIEQQDANAPPPPAPQQVLKTLKRLNAAGWVYTSISHTAARPRYRVVLPLGNAITKASNAVETLKASSLYAAKRLGILDWCAPESYVLSQPMFVPVKLTGMQYYSAANTGRNWSTKHATKEKAKLADIPDDPIDIVLGAIKRAGLYIGANPQHKGMHFIKCPHAEEHGVINDTQTVYYEAHFDGNPRPAVKCFDTAPDTDGTPHLSFSGLVRWLREKGYLTQEEQESEGVLDSFDTFDARSSIGELLSRPPKEREWAIEKFAPVGKVTVVAGPGGVSKSMLMLQLLIYGAIGTSWGNFELTTPLRSLYISYEDDRLEIHKRVHTLVSKIYADSDSEDPIGMREDLFDAVKNNVRVFAADDEAASWVLLDKPKRYDAPTRTARVDWLIDYLRTRDIKLLVLDPAVYTHRLEENDVADMANYMQTLSYVAKQANAAVVVLHHMHKTAGWSAIDDINQGSLRGASSFSDNSRSVLVIVNMPIKDAENYGLPPAQETSSRFAVVKHVKHNYSAPMPTQIIERVGGVILPRPDIRKMAEEEVREAREQQRQQHAHQRTLAMSLRVLEILHARNDALTTNQLALEAGTKTGRLKAAIEECEAQDWLELEAGPNRATYHRITPLGISYIKSTKLKDF